MFAVQNMRTAKVKEVRAKWQNSRFDLIFSVLLQVLSHNFSDRFFMGKNKVTKVALGKGEEDEYTSCKCLIVLELTPGSRYKDNLHLLSEKIAGNCGLMFTDSSRDDVLKY